MDDHKIYCLIDYEDDYVQPLILCAIRKQLPPELLIFISDLSELPSQHSRVLQWRQYERIDFNHLHSHTKTSLANSYIIRKALIRKHYLARTVDFWLAKYPDSVLGKHVKPSVSFEIDYAEFLDEALDESETSHLLRESWARNEAKADGESKEWWILKPGMSERGHGIRLFSSYEELQAIFEEWDPPPSDDEDNEVVANHISNEEKVTIYANGIVTQQLRHFVAQPYIHPPLLLPPVAGSSAGRKFHVRAYVLAVGALEVWVGREMLALFAQEEYEAPGEGANEKLGAHLTNTCLQTDDPDDEEAVKEVKDGSVRAFWSLPSSLPPFLAKQGVKEWRVKVWEQICTVTGELFRAAASSMSTHFQPLPNGFEIFALDFLVDEEGVVWMLEVNAFPDFKQTGSELRGVVEGLMEGVVEVGIGRFFGVGGEEACAQGNGKMVKVLEMDLGRR